MTEERAPSPEQRSALARVQKHVRTRLTTGILVLIPIYVTWVVLKFLFEKMDGILAPYVQRWIGFRIPGLGIVMTLLVVYLVGLLATRLIGQQLFGALDRLLSRAPIVRTIYNTLKQVSQILSPSGRSNFKRVVIIEYPRPGIKALGFVTGTVAGEDAQVFVNIFVPTSPNPTSGMLVIVPESEVLETSMTVEDGLKLIVSGGIVVPKELRVGGGPPAVS
jgi:uncharacterized membrane protein